MKLTTWFHKLPSGLRLHRLFQTIWSELVFPQSCPPGHFFSPIPDKAEVLRDADRIFDQDCHDLPEIDLQESVQLALLARLSQHAVEFPWRDHHARFRVKNDYLPAADAIVLLATLLETQPRSYVEIGSGFSSALVLDVRDRFLAGRVHCTFIEPDTGRLESLLRSTDTASSDVINKRVQEVGAQVFSQLEERDVLFVDGSHVSKVGSDLNDILFRILPLLKRGVLIHFHDIPWPFEYRREAVLRGRSWNEAYVLRAFLANNASYQIRLFASWLERCHAGEWYAAFPQARGSSASSLWLVKTGASV